MDNADIKLFCLPYAGGAASTVYHKWKKYLNNNIQLIPVELAGRGARYKECFYSSFDDAVNDLANIIRDNIGESRFALFGHSLGSLLAFKTVQKLMSLDYEPEHVFFSGMYPPCEHEGNCFIHNLPDKEFIEEILEFGGTPYEVINDNNLRSIFIPILRADYKLFELFEYNQKEGKFNFDISILCGTEDKKINQKDISKWSNYTNGKCAIYNFQGDHFFINQYCEQIISIINSILV